MGAHLDRLPTAADGEAGLEQLAELFGDDNVFSHIRWIRDHTAKPPIVGRTVQLLAASLLRHAMSEDRTAGRDIARARLAIKLGVKDNARTNLYHRHIDPGEKLAPGEKALKWVPPPDPGEQRYLDHLPTAADGEAGLRQLIWAFGSEAVFRYILWLRDRRPSKQDARAPLVGRFVENLAVRMVRQEMAEQLDQPDPERQTDSDDRQRQEGQEPLTREGTAQYLKRYQRARSAVAARLGYGRGRTWFYQILAAGERLMTTE